MKNTIHLLKFIMKVRKNKMLSIEDYEDKIKELNEKYTEEIKKLNEKIDKMTNTFFQINVLSDKIIEYYYMKKILKN